MGSSPILTSADAEQVLVYEAEQRRLNAFFPSDSSLTNHLARMLNRRGLAKDSTKVVHRDQSVRSSTFSNEIVTCRLDDGSELRLLCKYARQNSHAAFGHRRGIPYESEIYREVLEPLGLSTPRFYGSHSDSVTNEHWLVMEYIEGGVTVNKGPQPAAIISAAQWIGRFHAMAAKLLDSNLVKKLIPYDGDYYRGWAQRTFAYSAPLHDRYPWLNSFCRGYEDFVPNLTRFPPDVIHGEYTVHNVILRQPRIAREDWQNVSQAMGGISIAPIDWESSAIAFGEIDLALVLDGSWPEHVRNICIDQYQRARWGDAVPPTFLNAFRAAQLYLHLRWLGDRPAKTMLEKSSWRFQRLETVGREIGLI